MKRILIFGLLLTVLCCGEVRAQRQFRKPLRTTSQAKLGLSDYNIGLKVGCPWSYMTKSDLNKTAYDGHFGYSIGFMGERNIDKWSVGIESTFAQKGTKMHNEKQYQISLPHNGNSGEEGILKTQYEVAYNVVTIRTPVTYYFRGLFKDNEVVPYLFAGPEVDIPLGYNLNLWDFKLDTIVMAVTTQFDGPTGENPLEPIEKRFDPVLNASFVTGLGLMSMVRFENSAIFIKLDVAYNRGLLNLSVPTKEAWKWPFEEQKKHIFAHDLEINFSIVYPIKKILRDACYYFNKKK